jgi:Flp pilus assembly protein TadB
MTSENSSSSKTLVHKGKKRKGRGHLESWPSRLILLVCSACVVHGLDALALVLEAEVLVAVLLAVGFGIRTCNLGKRLPIRNKFLREGSVGGKPS